MLGSLNSFTAACSNPFEKILNVLCKTLSRDIRPIESSVIAGGCPLLLDSALHAVLTRDSKNIHSAVGRCAAKRDRDFDAPITVLSH